MYFLISIISFACAITIHEYAHALIADRLGDPTARLSGRLSFNPLAHLDLYGTILVPIFLIFLGSPFIFGWAKPVLFDPYNLKDPRKDSALISLAGPLANLTLALISSLILRLMFTPFSPFFLFSSFLRSLIAINVALAFFNMLPVHPLDGGKILVGILPEKDARMIDYYLEKYGILLILMLIFPFFGTSPLHILLSPFINFTLGLLIPSSPLI